MVRAAAATYAQRKIRVNAVAPGLTETRLGATVLKSDAMREAAVSMIPMKRINQPNEIASAIFWLLTDAPDNFTGQVLNLDEVWLMSETENGQWRNALPVKKLKNGKKEDGNSGQKNDINRDARKSIFCHRSTVPTYALASCMGSQS